ncbi:MAG: sigma-54-dependent Fis family transcriptional regulator, partial [Candidatus Binatia bacterium]
MRHIAKRNPRSVPPASSPTSPEMRQIARKWEYFVSGIEVDLSDIPPIIREAWIRSKQVGVDPALPYAPWHEIPNDPEILREEIDWLPCAERIFSLLAHFFIEPHQVICLVDHQGRLLSIRGGHKGLAVAEKIHAIPGGEWSEEKVGCNVFGTSLYTGLPVQAYWQENYLANIHEWTGQSAPIHHPTTGDILGAVGIGGHKELSHPHALELFIQAARMIEEEIQQQEASARLAILEHFAQLVARYPSDGLLAVDKHGRILTLNPLTEKILSLSRAQLVGQPVHAVTTLQQRLGTLDEVTSAKQLLREEGGPGVTLFPAPAGHTTGAIILLSQPAQPVAVKKHPEQPWRTTFTFADLVGQSPRFRECIARAHKASQYDWPVLLLGESGTGKELLAQSIHSASLRQSAPFVPLDCASI